MEKNSSILIRIDATTSAATRKLNEFTKKIKKEHRKLNKIGGELTNTLSKPLAVFAAGALYAHGEVQRLTLGLEAMMGGAKLAKDELEKLTIAAKAPGLGFEQAIEGSLRLQAVKFEASEARKIMSSFGNAIALAGGRGSSLNGVTTALSQIISKGKISAEEINQLAERVPQVRQAIEAAFGTSDSESLQKLNIDVKQFVLKVTEELEKLPKAVGGFSNSMENLKNASLRGFSQIGEAIDKTFNVTGGINALSNTIEGLAAAFSSMPEPMQSTILTLGGLAAATGPVVLGMASLLKLQGVTSNALLEVSKRVKGLVRSYKTMTAAQKRIIVLEGRIAKAQKNTTRQRYAQQLRRNKDIVNNTRASYVKYGIAIGVVSAAFIVLKSKLDSINSAHNELNKQLASIDSSVKSSTQGQLATAKSYLNILKDTSKSTVERTSALTKLNSISKEHFGSLKAGIVDLQAINAAEQSYAQAIIARAKATAIADQIAANSSKVSQLEAKKKSGATDFGDKISLAADFVLAGSPTTAKGLQASIDAYSALRNSLLGENNKIRSVSNSINKEIKDLKNASKNLEDELQGIIEGINKNPSINNVLGSKTGVSKRIKASIDLLPIGKSSISSIQSQLNKNPIQVLLEAKFKAASEVYDNLRGQLSSIATKEDIFGDSLEAAESRVKAITSALSALGERGFDSSTSEVKALLDELDNANEKLKGFKVDSIFSALKSEFESTSNLAKVFGDSFDSSAKKIESLKKAIKNLVNEGLDASNPKLAALITQLDEFKKADKAADKVNNLGKSFVSAFESGIEGTIQNIGLAFGDMFDSSKSAAEKQNALLATVFKGFGDMLIQLGKIAISTGISMEAIKQALNFGGGIGAVIAGGAAITLGAIVKAQASNLAKAPKLYKGGLAYGQTYAMVGDNPNAHIDPEVIAPLSKLKPMLKPQIPSFQIGDLRLRGRDLIAAIRVNENLSGIY